MARFEHGDRVELVSTTDEHTSLEPGDRGTVSSVMTIEEPIGPETQVWVDWDDGGKLAMILGEDEIKKVGESGTNPTSEGLDEARLRAYCRAVGGELFETSGGTLTCEVAGGRVFGTAGEIVVELRPNDDVIVRATPEIGLGRDLRVTAHSRLWRLDQGVDDGNLLTTLRTVDDADADVNVNLGVYGPEARRVGPGEIEVVGVDPDDVLLDHG